MIGNDNFYHLIEACIRGARLKGLGIPVLPGMSVQAHSSLSYMATEHCAEWA